LCVRQDLNPHPALRIPPASSQRDLGFKAPLVLRKNKPKFFHRPCPVKTLYLKKSYKVFIEVSGGEDIFMGLLCKSNIPRESVLKKVIFTGALPNTDLY